MGQLFLYPAETLLYINLLSANCTFINIQLVNLILRVLKVIEGCSSPLGSYEVGRWARLWQCWALEQPATGAAAAPAPCWRGSSMCEWRPTRDRCRSTGNRSCCCTETRSTCSPRTGLVRVARLNGTA